MKLNSLLLWNLHDVGSCAFQMSLDEALFHFSREHEVAVARFYRWERPAVTFGYSEPYPTDSAAPAIRRFTGGGMVEHGRDLTFLLAFPSSTAFARETANRRYEWIHQAILDALGPFGIPLHLSRENHPLPIGPCFEHPVLSDLISDEKGDKVGGGAQRRSRGAVIHQGSIRLPEALRKKHNEWTTPFLATLAKEVAPFPAAEQGQVVESAEKLRTTRYQSAEWNHRR